MVVNLAEPSNVLEGRHSHKGLAICFIHTRHPSSLETVIVVPGQSVGIRPLTDAIGANDPLTVEGIIVLAVVELLVNVPADLEVKVGRHRHIACVKQAVDVAPQEKPIRGFMLAAEVMRLNPKFSVSRHMKAYSLHDPARNAWYRDLLLRAGLPE